MISLNYKSVAQIIEAAQKQQKPISQIVLTEQAHAMQKKEEELYVRMKDTYQIMRESVEKGLSPGVKSASGLTGGDAYQMHLHLKQAPSLIGGILPQALAAALAVSEWNAAMGRIVAAPTAGSCGILPAALITMQSAHNLSQEACVRSLFTAAGFGMVIANNANVSGAEGGCQAECGSAAAMAAASLCELFGGTPEMSGHAAAIALQNVMGLVCDPVAGLVEIPCEKRNASGVANAFISAELALAGIRSRIPVDEVILAMKQVGDALPKSLRETAEGGLAITPTGQKLYEQVFGVKEGGHCTGCCGCQH